MNDWRYARSGRHEVVAIPKVWLAFLLSLCIHAAALWLLVPKLDIMAGGIAGNAQPQSSIAVRIQPPPSPPAVASATQPAAPPKTAEAPSRSPPRTTQPKRRPVPQNVITLDRRDTRAPTPSVPPPIEAPVPRAEPPTVEPKRPVERPPTVAAKPSESDLASYIAARKRERGESLSSSEPDAATKEKSAEDDIKRRDEIVARNLGLNETPSFGYDPRRAGGIFQIEHMDSDYADFYYLGFDKDIRRKARLLIEVRRGTERDIRIAIVHKMIAIIRENVSGDFVWLSRNGPVTMSARPGDNAELERFILSDVFPDARLER